MARSNGNRTSVSRTDGEHSTIELPVGKGILRRCIFICEIIFKKIGVNPVIIYTQ